MQSPYFIVSYNGKIAALKENTEQSLSCVLCRSQVNGVVTFTQRIAVRLFKCLSNIAFSVPFSAYNLPIYLVTRQITIVHLAILTSFIPLFPHSLMCRYLSIVFARTLSVSLLPPSLSLSLSLCLSLALSISLSLSRSLSLFLSRSLYLSSMRAIRKIGNVR